MHDITEHWALDTGYWILDTGDTNAYFNMFTKDAEVTESAPDGRYESCKGHDEIRALALHFHDNPDFPGHQHHIDQVVIDPAPSGRPDHWLVRSYATATISKPPKPPYIHSCGHISDTVTKIDGKWLICAKANDGWEGDVLKRFNSSD